ncbi:MAG: tetratricopeptide repeat protein [Verrucomicrobiota bacterium]|jgi:lipoprotein NlpI
MNGYFFTASVTRSQHLGPERTVCTCSIVCADNADAARKRFEELLRAQPEGEIPTRTQINKLVAAQFVEQLLTETGFVPMDWARIAREAQANLESISADDFEQGYWVDVNAVLQPSSDIEALRADLPEDIGSGLNWAGDKQFLFLLSVLSPPPPAPPESWEEPEAGAAEAGQPAEETAGESAFGLVDPEADFPELVDKEVAVMIRARNSAVAAWLWRKYAPDASLAGNPIRIDPWCGVVGLEGEADPDIAIAACTKAIELNPEDASAYFDRGSAKCAKEDFDGAIADYTKAVELKPDDEKACFARGYAKQMKGDMDGAIADYGKAIELKPNYAGACFGRGVAKKSKGDMAGAVADYGKAIELNPQFVSARYSRGCLRYDAREFQDALVDFRGVIELQPITDFADFVRFRVWLIRVRLGETEAANAELLTYLSGRTTGNADDWAYKIGQFLAGQLSESELLAAAKNNKSKTEAGQFCEAYFYAGSKHLFAGDKSAAADCFQKSIATGAKTYLGYDSAAAELKFLKASSPAP